MGVKKGGNGRNNSGGGRKIFGHRRNNFRGKSEFVGDGVGKRMGSENHIGGKIN